jgi:hypothetical protein
MRLVCGRLTARSGQLELFAAEPTLSPHAEALQDSLDQLRTKYGMAAVRWGRGIRNA